MLLKFSCRPNSAVKMKIHLVPLDFGKENPSIPKS